MYSIVRAEKVHVSLIVTALNRSNHSHALYHKNQKTIEDIERQLSSWHCVMLQNTGNTTSNPLAFIKVVSHNWVNRVVRYELLMLDRSDPKGLLKQAISYIFSTFNCQKATTDVIYDRSDLIKSYIAIGGMIEVRKRNHLFSEGKYFHVVEMSFFENEIQNE